METVIAPETRYTYEVKGDVVLASWNEALSVESEEFLESLEHLFRFATERKLKKVLLDSGIPAGGTLTENVMLLVQKSMAGIDLEKIAILESCDFHWDNNLIQFLKYLRSYLQLNYELRMFIAKTSALEWLGVGKV